MMIILEEHPGYMPRTDLMMWNNKQKNLWLYFVDSGLVTKNDIDKFFSFATRFRQFWDQKARFPSKKEAEKLL